MTRSLKLVTPNTPPVESAINNQQLGLFQSFICNTDEQRGNLSNVVLLLDNVPRFSVSRQAQSKARSADGRLNLLKIPFQHRRDQYTVVIQPARIEVPVKKGSKEMMEVDFYPSALEELIEDALRKLATEQNQGFFDKDKYTSGVVFTLYMLREELKRRGHTRSYHEIVQSLYIMAKSNIEIFEGDNKVSSVALSNYFSAMVVVGKDELALDQNAKWSVQFHPLVTKSIDQLHYRQFNYDLWMSHNSQLSRWIHKLLVQKWTFAAANKPFKLRFSTIRRDSALLNGYAEDRFAMRACIESMEELKADGLLSDFTRQETRGARKVFVDATFTLYPSAEFIAQVKAANKRLIDAGKATPEQFANDAARNQNLDDDDTF